MKTRVLLSAFALTFVVALTPVTYARPQEPALPDNCTDVNAQLDKLYAELSDRRDAIEVLQRNADLFAHPSPTFAREQLTKVEDEIDAERASSGSPVTAASAERRRYLVQRRSYWQFWVDNRVSPAAPAAALSPTTVLYPNELPDAVLYAENTTARWDRDLEKRRAAYAKTDRDISRRRAISETLKCNTYAPSTPYNPLSRPVPALGGRYLLNSVFVVVTQVDKRLTFDILLPAEAGAAYLGDETRKYVCTVMEVRVDGGDLSCQIATSYGKSTFRTDIKQSLFFEIKSGNVTFIQTERAEFMSYIR